MGRFTKLRNWFLIRFRAIPQLNDGSLEISNLKNFYRVVKPITVWKKAWSCNSSAIVELQLQPGALVYCNWALNLPRPNGVWATNLLKCRASMASVISIVDEKGDRINTANSLVERYFYYRVGEIVEPAAGFSFADDQCDSGIHFFFDRNVAKSYN